MEIKYKYATLLVTMLLGMLAFLAQKKTPIPIGDAEDYWEFACGVELKKFDGYFPYANSTGTYPDIDGWYFYYYQEHHGQHVFKVSKQSLATQTSEVFTLLDRKISSTAQNYIYDDKLELKNAKRLACLGIKESTEAMDFIDQVSSVSSRDPNKAREIGNFQQQWERSKIYWASILFEATFIPLWWLFSFHTGVFGKYNKTLSLRVAFSPLILFSPYFLGYSPYLFSFSTNGGILYPIFAMLIGLPFGWIPLNPIDIELLKVLPRPLSYISQVPHSPMAMSFFGRISPTILCAFAVLILSASRLLGEIRGKRRDRCDDGPDET